MVTALNMRPCNTGCPAFQRCHHLEPGLSDNLLAPFNKELLIRLFRSLPAGKGKARYFTLYIRDILQRLAQGEELLTVMQSYVKSERAVYHAKKQVAQMYELYGPLADDVTINTIGLEVDHLHQFFQLQVSDEM